MKKWNLVFVTLIGIVFFNFSASSGIKFSKNELYSFSSQDEPKSPERINNKETKPENDQEIESDRKKRIKHIEDACNYEAEVCEASGKGCWRISKYPLRIFSWILPYIAFVINTAAVSVGDQQTKSILGWITFSLVTTGAFLNTFDIFIEYDLRKTNKNLLEENNNLGEKAEKGNELVDVYVPFMEEINKKLIKEKEKLIRSSFKKQQPKKPAPKRMEPKKDEAKKEMPKPKIEPKKEMPKPKREEPKKEMPEPKKEEPKKDKAKKVMPKPKNEAKINNFLDSEQTEKRENGLSILNLKKETDDFILDKFISDSDEKIRMGKEYLKRYRGIHPHKII